MKFIILILCLSILTSCTSFIKRGDIELSDNEGSLPFQVKVKGPNSLTSKGYGKPMLFSDCGFTINWGDGSESPEDCGERLAHEYTTAGKYEVVARLWHPGMGDEPITTWIGKAEVNVFSNNENISTIKNLEFNGDEFEYQHLPLLFVNFITSEKVNLKVELLTKNNEIITSRIDEGISYDGSKSYYVHVTSSPLYIQSLLNGDEIFKYRVTMIKNEKEISEQTSRTFISSAEMQSENLRKQFEVITSNINGITTISAYFKAYHPACFNYEIDWGDGIKEKSEHEIKNESCLSDSKIIFLMDHKYNAPGTYKIKLKTNQFDIWKKLDEIPSYLSNEVYIYN